MHSRSSRFRLSNSVTKKPLLRMLRCDSVAPLGNPVVPEVYWTLTGSVLANAAERAVSSRSGIDFPQSRRVSKSSLSRKTTSLSSAQPGLTSEIMLR
ncbi:hypothetical protein MHEC_47780 [Mycobacterium heckeshornense]|uniref:Uncharacterized protein n=1 Tax=Mycobacterium heckeshornense TaxID=110505 RepID=A0A7R7JJW1_9MYCO|nr:hypothetical protein MHEC_47780 [Mycobacterium heckeshornense]